MYRLGIAEISLRPKRYTALTFFFLTKLVKKIPIFNLRLKIGLKNTIQTIANYNDRKDRMTYFWIFVFLNFFLVFVFCNFFLVFVFCNFFGIL